MGFNSGFKGLRGSIFSWLIVMQEVQKKGLSLDKELKDFSNTFSVIVTHVSVNS